MKNILIVIVVILILIGGYYVLDAYVFDDGSGTSITDNNNNDQEGQVVDSVLGCYVATLGQDVYSLKITSQNGASTSGTLVFDNFQKDSSQGSFQGTYQDGILLGNYSFSSEGTNSVMQVVFKKSGDNFIRGFGPLDSTGTKFSNLSQVTYDSNQTFESKASCVTSL